MKIKKKILIMGGTGFIGKNLVNYFQNKKKYIIYATYFKSKKPLIKNVKWIKTDLTKEYAVKKITQNIDIVIQAAATTSGAKDIVNKPYLHVTDNAVMNSLILKSCFENNTKHFIFFSCTVMYKSNNRPLKETDFNPKDLIYPKYFGVANTKLFIEKMCEFYSRICKTKFTCIRHSNIYGPHDKFDLNKSHFFGASINKVAMAKKTINIWGSGKEKRDLLYIDDLTNFVDKSIQNQKKKFRIYNCGLGKCYSVINVVKKIIKKFDKKQIEIKLDKTKPSINTSLALNSQLALKELKWKPKISLDQGIEKTIRWFKESYEK
jgi:GDP-L-fucose synthase